MKKSKIEPKHIFGILWRVIGIIMVTFLVWHRYSPYAIHSVYNAISLTIYSILSILGAIPILFIGAILVKYLIAVAKFILIMFIAIIVSLIKLPQGEPKNDING